MDSTTRSHLRASQGPARTRSTARTGARRAAAVLTGAACAAAATLLLSSAGAQDDRPQQGADPAGDAAVLAAFAAAEVQVDRDGGAVAFPVAVEVRADALEYLLVTPLGAVHESLFVTESDPEILNAALLLVGAERGKNVEYTPIDPPPSREEVRSGAPTHDVALPEGAPIFVYAAWREPAGAFDAETGTFPAETLHFHRVEDLVLDLERQRTLRRHGWVYLGSRMVPGQREGDAERFAATATGNLVCTTFFTDGDTLLTTAVPECTSQTIWFPNNWLLPARGSELLFIASRTELERVPVAFADTVPFVPEPAAAENR